MSDRFNIEDLGLPELMKVFDELKKKINDSAETMSGAAKKMSDSSKNYTKSITDIDSRIDQLTQTIVDFKEKQDELRNQFKTGKITQTEYNREMAKTGHAINRANNDRKKYINVIQSEIGSIKRAKAENQIWRRERNELGKSTSKNRKLLEEYNKSINKNTALIKKNVDSQSRSFMSANKLAGAFRSIAMAMGVSLGAYGIFRVLKNAVGIMTSFQEQMSKVKAVTGATGEEIKKLELDAIRLGGTVPKTASEVANLQFEFAKLGFTTQEILNATEATIQLSIATGADLARSAEVAGTTLRGFGLVASETQRIVDVMAESINRTALDMEDFPESMKYVAPIAKAAGLSLEETTAMLSKLADAGIRGSMAGTSLRMIISQLDKTGKKTTESIKDLAERGLTLADAQDEVGQRAKTALLILADQIEEIDKLTESYKECGGAAQEMADIMQENVVGAVKKLQSAWEKFILTARKSNDFFMLFIDMLTAAVEGVTPFDKASKSMKAYNERLGVLTATIKGMNDEFARREIQTYILEMDELIVDMFNSMEHTSRRGKKLYDAWINGIVELRNYLQGVLLDEKKLHELTSISAADDIDKKKKVTGIINELNEQLKINRDLKREATSPELIQRYDNEIKRIEALVYFYNELNGSLDNLIIKLKDLEIDEELIPDIGDFEIDDSDIEKTIESLRKFGFMKGIDFEKELTELKGLYDKGLITEGQYLIKRLELWTEHNEQIIEAFDIFGNEVISLFNTLNDAELDYAQKKIDIAEDRISKLEDQLKDEKSLKDEGKANDYDRLTTQIAEENRIRDKAVKDYEKLQKREAAIQLASQTGSIITASAKTIEGWSSIPFVGVLLGLAQVAALIAAFASYKAKIKAMKGYAEGTEYVERGNSPRGKDTIHARLNEGERVISTEDNKKLGSMSNEELVKELQYLNYYKNRLPGVTPKDTVNELIDQLKRQEQIQQETLDFMKSDTKLIPLGNGKAMIKKGNYTEIITYAGI